MENLCSTIDNTSLTQSNHFEDTNNDQSANCNKEYRPKPPSDKTNVLASVSSDKAPNPNDTTWCTSNGEVSKSDITRTETDIQRSSNAQATQKSNPDMDLKLIVIGDKTIKDISFEDRRSCYKIAYQSPSPKKSLNNISYLIKTRFKNTRAILYQISINEIMNIPSEILKRQLADLVKFLQNSNIQLLISGPIPPYGLKTGVFSRVVCIDDWLSIWSGSVNINYVSNFDLFWKKKHLFNRNGSLNRTGAMFLTDNITFAMENYYTSC